MFLESRNQATPEGNITYLLLSARFPKEVEDLGRTIAAGQRIATLQNLSGFRVGRARDSHENISQRIMFTDPAQKQQ